MELVSSLLWDAFFAAVAAVGFALISNPPKSAILYAAILAAIGHSFRLFLMRQWDINLVVGTLLASFLMGILSLYFAKRIHRPAEIFTFPSLLPMIPGMYAYNTIFSLVKFTEATDPEVMPGIVVDIFRNGLTTVFVMVALGVGRALPFFFFYKQSFMMTRLKN